MKGVGSGERGGDRVGIGWGSGGDRVGIGWGGIHQM